MRWSFGAMLAKRTRSAPSPRSSRGEGWGEGQSIRSAACRESPSPGSLRDPTSPRKRGEVRLAALLRPIAAALFAAIASQAAHAQSVADFYRGKTVEILVGAAAGGGYDVVARLIASHMPRHIPGNPAIVVRNMPGATGLIMTNHLYNVPRRDGTVLGMPTSNVPIEPRLRLISPDGSAIKFDIARFGWIGTPLQEPQVTWVWHTAPAMSAADLKKTTILMGATTATADNFILPMLVNQTAGTRMKPVTGYQGQNEINIAAERGEVQGNNTGLSNLTVNRADWLRDGKVRILIQYGTKRLPVIKDVPTAMELAPSDADRAVLRTYAAKFAMARPLAVVTDAADRVAALQAAFAATMQDAQYLSDAKKVGLDTNWIGGPELTDMVRQVDATPQPVVDRLRELLARSGAK
jgi:tripartite-type tricarboxylate transporter receptor subunit TctC